MKKITKKESAAFHKNCEAMFKNELGAIENPNPSRSYNLIMETGTGPLYIRVDDDNVHCYSVFANFLGNEQKAKLKFGHWKNNTHKWALDGNELIEFIKNHYLAIKNT